MRVESWSKPLGHTTFFDSESGRFLDDPSGNYNYLDYTRNEMVFVRELCFWKI